MPAQCEAAYFPLGVIGGKLLPEPVVLVPPMLPAPELSGMVLPEEPGRLPELPELPEVPEPPEGPEPPELPGLP